MVLRNALVVIWRASPDCPQLGKLQSGRSVASECNNATAITLTSRDGRTSLSFILVLPIEPRSNIGQRVSIKCSIETFRNVSDMRSREHVVYEDSLANITAGLDSWDKDKAE